MKKMKTIKLLKPKEVWCPTQGGEYTAYVPEYLEGEVWKRIPIEYSKVGIPQPLESGHINSVIGLFGYEQAQALMWKYAAYASATIIKHPKVRLQMYEVHYDIKAKKINMKKTS